MVFQSEGPMIGNARSPKVTVLLRGGSRGKSETDLNSRTDLYGITSSERLDSQLAARTNL